MAKLNSFNLLSIKHSEIERASKERSAVSLVSAVALRWSDSIGLMLALSKSLLIRRLLPVQRPPTLAYNHVGHDRESAL